MIFIERIRILNDMFSEDYKKKEEGLTLYGLYDKQPPIARHIIYSPMSPILMKELVKNYKREFPDELLNVFKNMNGADMFWSVRVVGKNKTRIPCNFFTIFGVPLTNDRKHLEPFNISIEDLERPDGTPNSWLKFGFYNHPEDISMRRDLYVDTEGMGVFSVEHSSERCVIKDKWDTIDCCLCDIWDILSNYMKMNCVEM